MLYKAGFLLVVSPALALHSSARSAVGKKILFASALLRQGYGGQNTCFASILVAGAGFEPATFGL